MPVHVGVGADDLRAALDSLLHQTHVPDEVVIVEDGPLEAGQLDAILEFERAHPNVVRVRLPINRGAGVANNAGLLAASGTWIAKFDADDICLPHRIERQLATLAGTGADVCGSAMLEFVDNPDRPVALRTNPLGHDAIARQMRFNNPINHPSSMYRRVSAIAVGGYADLRFMQDYDLFARLLAAGARMVNIEEALVLFRAGEGMRRRRSGREFTVLEWDLQRRLHSYGLIGRTRILANLVTRLTFRKLPAPLMRMAYRHLLSRSLAPPVAANIGEGPMRLSGAAVRHQARLLGRTVRELIRRPSVGHELVRLAATRGRSTMRLRMPWLPFRLIDELAVIVGQGTRVFEYGGGGSTLWLLDRGATVVTVEHDAGWAYGLRRQVTSGAWTMLERGTEDSYASYVAAIEAYDDASFDIVLVDGRERARCVAAALSKVRPGGLLIVDDSDRERYQSAIAAIGWPRRDVVGFAPAKPTLAYSAVLRRPEVDG